MTTARARAVAVVLDRDRLLVMRRRRGERAYAVLPGGGVESGERPRDAVLRELREETGLEGRIEQELWTIRHDDRLAHYFRVSVERQALAMSGPELLASSARNVYQPAWIDCEEIDAINLQPAEIRDRLRTLR